MPRGQLRAQDHSAASGRPGPRTTQGQAHARIQAQAEAPFGNLLAAGLIAGAVSGVIEDRMAEAASRHTGPGIPTVPPAKDAIPDEGRDPGTGGPVPSDDGRAEGASSDAALSPSAGPDRAGPDAAPLKLPSTLPADAAELPALLQGHAVSAASILPAARHATSDPLADGVGAAPDALVGRITDEIVDTIGRVVVKLGEISESGGLTGLDPRFGETLIQEILGAAARIATDLTSTFGLSPTDTAALTKVASLPSQVLADVTGTVDHAIGAIDIPASLLGAEEDHLTPPLLSRVFDHAEPAQPSAPQTPDLKLPGDAGDTAISHPATDVGAVSIIFAGQSYADAHDAHDWAFGPVTNLLHGFV